MNAKYYITNDLAVDRRFEARLASTGKADLALWLCVAPEIGAARPAAIIYLATNGDPVYLAALGSEGFIHLGEDETDEDEPRPMWQWALEQFGFVGDSESEAEDFIDGLWENPVNR